MTSTNKVLIAAPVHEVLLEGLARLGYECLVSERITQGAAYELVKDCVGIVTSTRLQLDRSLIDAAPHLQWIGRMGSGMEVIDTAYAAEKGIACFGSPEGNCNAVGEHALGMLLALIRRIAVGHAEVKAGVWKREENRGIELEGRTIGIIGYGHTGSALAKKLAGFDMRILAYDKYEPAGIPPHIVRCESLDPICEQADIVSFHVPLQADTVHYFDAAFVERMQRPFILINTSRGVVVDTAALLDGLNNGKIAGACLDVLEQEPLAAMTPELRHTVDLLLQRDNVIITPHIAGYTHEAVYKMSKALLSKIPHPAR